MGGDAMAGNYSAFLSALASSMHSVGREAEMALDAGGILREYARYAATGVDKMMTMATCKTAPGVAACVLAVSLS